VGLISVVSALLLAAGAVLSKTVPSLLTHGEPMTAGARVFADYLFARNLSLAMMFLLLLFTGHRRLLAGLMVLTALVQAFDIINLLARREFVLMPGLMLYLGALLLGASKLLGCRVWRARAWQEPSSEVNYTN
jgi:phosphatidylserine synthase